jgi:hypothetical protein
MSQFISLSDLAGIAPEIILTLTAICILSFDMIKISKVSIHIAVNVKIISGAIPAKSDKLIN